MNSKQNTYLTPNEFTATVVAALLGVGIMYMPNSLIKYAKQDSWMGSILGGAYPLYMLILVNYICSKYPDENVLDLCKKYIGPLFGNILNLIFVSFFLFVETSELAAFSNILKVYATSFLKDYQIFIAALLPIAYIVYKGIKPLARLNLMIFYLSLILIIIPIGALLYGSVLNIKPIFGVSIKNILLASKETAFFYTGMETVFLIYPFAQDKKKLFKCGLMGTIFILGTYSWTVFLTIYYLGVDISPKYLWPLIALSDSINIPVVTSFRYIFISLWALVVLKCMATYYFSISYGLSIIIKNVSSEKFTVLLYPVIIGLSFLYGNPTTRRYYTGKLTEYYVAYNLAYISLIAVIVYFKRGDVGEKG